MLKPKFITFTGADDATDISEMVDLSQRHAVEFGILFSRKRAGDARYPSQSWMEKLEGKPITLAAHVCGAWASEINTTGRSEIFDRLVMFDRIQINTAAPLDIENLVAFGDALTAKAGRRIDIILQARSDFPDEPRLHWLFDCSGGLGIPPKEWPAPPRGDDVKFGYAGGLGPDTVLSALQAMPSVEGVWIDMETRVRNAKDEFDLSMCRSVCEIVEQAALELKGNGL